MMTKNGILGHTAFTGKERDGEKEGSRGPFASERGDEPRSGIPNGSTYSYTYFGARYMDHEFSMNYPLINGQLDGNYMLNSQSLKSFNNLIINKINC